jgi:hypothetical protein
MNHLGLDRVLVLVAASLAACEGSDSTPGGAVDTGVVDVGAPKNCNPSSPAVVPPPTGCTNPATDYTPRDLASAGTRYPVCISDDNAYHPFNIDVPANGRIGAIAEMGKLLAWDGSRVPTPADFDAARIAYTQPEGVDSRVQRREDIHYPPAPKECKDMTPDEIATYRDRCVGPGKILPIINDAFAKGTKGIDPTIQAARIEGALLWMNWVSVFKEAMGCETAVEQCDSTTGWWAGNQDRKATPTAFSFASNVKALSVEGYERQWDSILAVRCWRDSDNPTGKAVNLTLRDKAKAQLDRSNNHGLALIVRHRLQNVSCVSAWETVKILGGALDFVATNADPAKAKILRDELAKPDPNTADTKAAIAALDALFPCP